MRPEISVAVALYNESATVDVVCHEIRDVLLGTGRAFELLLIDDGSTDGSAALADDLAASHPDVRVLHHETNKGLGGVYRTGFTEARGEYLTFFPADGQFPAASILEFLAAMEDADLALGLIDPGKRPLIGRILSWIERLMYRVLVGSMPRFQGIFMIRTSLLQTFPLHSQGRGWGIVMECILRACRGGARVRHVMTEVRPRQAGESKVQNWKTIFANVRQVLQLRSVLRKL